jgi:dephospho-CoA kinase
MLRIGLTGGIGAGKSTVAGRLVERGATVVDADRIAREVVAKGSQGLAEVVTAFGPELLDPDGALDRAALAAIVFTDPEARARLNGIVHPLIGRRTAELIASAPPDAVVVQDIPLLVEGAMAASFPLVIVVDADPEERVRRLVNSRGMPERDARARMAAQADRDARRAVADIWLDNSGTPERLWPEIDRLWHDRLVPFERNMRLGVRSVPAARSVDAQRWDESAADWPAQASRIGARVGRAAGDRGRRVDHVGATAVPGLAARDVLELQLSVAAPLDLDAVLPGLTEVGFLPADPPAPTERLLASADPGRPAELRIVVDGTSEARRALLLRDWLRADAEARRDFLQVKREGAGAGAACGYARDEEAWWQARQDCAERWARSTEWSTAKHGSQPSPA